MNCLSLVLLMLGVCGLATSYAVPGAGNQRENLASVAQVCDDPCLLCGLLIDYQVEQYYDQDAAPTQKSNKQSKLEQFMSLASTARRPPAGKREADNADTCFDVCALCWGQDLNVKEKVLERVMINSILQKFADSH